MDNTRLVINTLKKALRCYTQEGVLPLGSLNEALLKLNVELDRAVTEGKPTEVLEALIKDIKEVKSYTL